MCIRVCNEAVRPGEYADVVWRLAVAKERFVEWESETDRERVLWEEVWPFEDKK